MIFLAWLGFIVLAALFAVGFASLFIDLPTDFIYQDPNDHE